MNKGKGQTGQSSQPSRELIRWKEDMDHILLNAMVDEIHKGNRVDGSWTSEAYANIVQTLRSAGLRDVTKNHIKNRQKTMKDKWREVHDLFNGLSGFAWSPITKRFEAEDEVWDDLIRAKPSAAKWRTCQIRHYDLLHELYSFDRASGYMGLTPRQLHRALEKDNQTIDLNDAIADTTMNDEDVRNFDDIQVSPPNVGSFSPPYAQSIPSTRTSGSRGTKRKAPMVDVLDAQMDKLTAGLDRVAEAIISGNALTEKLSQVVERQASIAERQVVAIENRNEIIREQVVVLRRSTARVISEEDVWDALTVMNIEDQYRMQCYDYLCNNDAQKRKLFGIPAHLRLQELIRMMTEAGF